MQRPLSLPGAAAIALAVACVPAQAWIPQKSGVAATSQIILSRPVAGSATLDFFSAVGWSSFQTIQSTDTLVYSYFPVAGRISGLITRGSTSLTGIQAQAITLYKNGSATAVTCTLNVSNPTSCTSAGTADVVAGDYVSWLVHPTGTAPSGNRITAALAFTPTTPNDTVIFGQIQSAPTGANSAVHTSSNYNPTTPSTKTNATIPDSGTIDKLFVNLSAAPGAGGTGKKFDLYLDKGGVHTALTVPALETVTSGSDVNPAHAVSVTGPSGTTAGDNLQFETSPTSTPTAGINVAFGARFVPATSGSFWVSPANRLVETTTATFYYPLTTSSDGGSATEASYQFVTKAMTVTKISVKTDTAPGVGKTKTYTLRVNGADSALTCSITNTTSTFGCTASGTVTLAEGDLINHSIATSGTPAIGAASISLLAHP